MKDISGVDISGVDISANQVPVFPKPRIASFLITMPGVKEREDQVKHLQEKFNPHVIKAITNENPARGNCLSHAQVARFAKLLYPDLPYLVLEDDAQVVDPKFWTLVEEHKDVDLLYFGYNGSCHHTIPVETEYLWGTHAVLVSVKARDAILEHFDDVSNLEFWTDKVGFDSLLTVIAHKAGLTTWAPPKEDRYKYICQKEGLTSLISGNKRENILES